MSPRLYITVWYFSQGIYHQLIIFGPKCEPWFVYLQDLDADAEGKVSLHQLTNLLESVVDEQSDGEWNSVN